MKLGVHDNHCPSALSVVYAWGVENGYEIVHYDALPETNQCEIPQKFLINPILPANEGQYWENIQKCVKTNPQTHFGMIIPSALRSEMNTAQTALRGLENVTYFGFGDTERLFDFLQQRTSSSNAKRN
jgi:hypothetical protein